MSEAGQAFQVLPLPDGLAELRFDLPGESVPRWTIWPSRACSRTKSTTSPIGTPVSVFQPVRISGFTVLQSSLDSAPNAPSPPEASKAKGLPGSPRKALENANASLQALG